uniref:Nudix hydrolase n=1 Tax=Dikerogammarus haemobaphes virus 1 TaxID=2704946 RepID=A0A6G9HDE2_9VIRU|nr:nudix hydrolase [Dikerogammarus haemobaphes virus 1]
MLILHKDIEGVKDLFETRKCNGGIVIFNEKFIYLIYERGRIRDFGGKTEDCDENTWTTACREFKEETGMVDHSVQEETDMVDHSVQEETSVAKHSVQEETSVAKHSVQKKVVLKKEWVKFITELSKPYYFIFYVYSQNIAAMLEERIKRDNLVAKHGSVIAVPINELLTRKRGTAFCYRINGISKRLQLNREVSLYLNKLIFNLANPPPPPLSPWRGWVSFCKSKPKQKKWDLSFVRFPFLYPHNMLI